MNHGFYLGKIPYESIVSISLDSWRPSLLKLSFSDESYIFLPSRGFENHTEFIDQLSEKLKNTQGAEVFAKLKQPKRFNNLQTFIYSLAYAPTIFLLFSMSIDNFEPRVWKEELTPWSARAISPDSDGTVWIGAKNYHTNNVYIWHLTETDREHWTFSAEACNFCDSIAISHDLTGNPIVFTNEKDPNDGTKWISGIYIWNGNSWKRSSIELIEIFPWKQISIDSRLWGIKNNNLTYFDFAKNETKEIPAPDKVLSFGLVHNDIKVNLDGSLLLKFSEKGKPTSFYQVKNENWQLIYEGEFPNNRPLQDFCQDSQGNIWALTTDLRNQLPQIGLYDVLKSKWYWKDLKMEQSNRSIGYFKDMAVDAQGRIWILGVYNKDGEHDFLDFVMVAKDEENSIMPVIEYTDKNSNLKYVDFVVTTKERTWLGGSNLFWVDSIQELPSHLPDWIVWMKQIQDDHFGWYFLVFMGQILLALIGVSLEYK